MKLKKDRLDDGFTVEREGALIICRLRGKVTKAMVDASLKATAEHVAQIDKRHTEYYLLLDVSKVAKTNSASRSQAKNLAELHFTRVAVFGRNRLVMSIGQYIARAAKMAGYTKFFDRESEARSWLANGRTKHHQKPIVSVVGGLLVGLVGVLALLGWQLKNSGLERFMTNLRPMNPMAAVGLIVMGVGFWAFYAGKRRLLYCTALYAVGLGIAALLPLHIDYLLYGGRVTAAGAHTALADSAAVCFIAVGLTSLLSFKTGKVIKWLQYVCVIVVLDLSLFNIYGQLYAHDFIYGISPHFVMAFNLAIAFLIAGCTMLLIGIGRRVGNVLGLVTRAGWLIIPALLFVQIFTYATWAQERHRNDIESRQAFNSQVSDATDTISGHIQAYTDALAGYQGFFKASEHVSQGDFQTYYDTLDLAKRYPGLRSIVYLQGLTTSQIPAYVAQQRKDTSLFPDGNPGFTPSALSNGSMHYLVSYNPTNKTQTGLGRDLSSAPGRLAIYNQAIATGRPVASGPLTLAATGNQKPQQGFFIAVPVRTEGQQRSSGIVIAVFNYADFFPKLLLSQDKNRSLQVSISDGSKQIFATSKYDGTHGFTLKNRLNVAGRDWTVRGEASTNFGLSESQVNVPPTILVIGQLFSILLIAIFISQSRSRDRAVRLAEAITKDLNHERDAAVAVQEKDDAILSSIGDAVFAIDTHGKLTLFNPVAAHMSGFAQEEALGKHYHDILNFVHEATGKRNDTFIRQALLGHVTSMKNHTALIRKDGAHVAVADSAAPIRDSNRRIIGVIVVFRDVSKEQQLDRAKTEFVSLASHQLRTPLSAINWYSEMLMNGDVGKLTKQQHEYMQQIFEGNQRMIDLVNSLLDVSRLDLGKFTNIPAPTDLADTVASLEQELVGQISAKKIDFTMSIAKLPKLQIDPKLLRMIVQNLLSNAVKYTADAGKVNITAKPASKEQVAAAHLHDGSYVALQVSDTGCGIPLAQQTKVFSKLFRADNVQAMDVEGTGLGLYIVKEVIDRLGGHVWFESKENEGTTFYVLLPEVTTATKTT